MGTRILTLQQRAREIGRIRLGAKVDGGRPASLETFRFTSSSREFIEWCAEVYGGTVEEWDSPAGQAWEVLTEAKEMEVAIPSWADPVMQAYELWSGAGCQRRCDGITEQISGESCMCNPDNRECKPTTRLLLVIPSCPIMGVVRLETHGVIAASEIPGVVDGVSAARDAGVNLRATLRLERKKSGMKEFVVPALEVRASLAAIESGDIVKAMPALPTPRTDELEIIEIEHPDDDDKEQKITVVQAKALFARARDVYGDEGDETLRSLLNGRPSQDLTVGEFELLMEDMA
ncbi:MAG: hypothetical protein ACO3CU_07475 [Candidatus Nanopelagicales bacterium]